MQTIALNLIPKGPNPICYCSQYDSGRIIRIELYEGNNPYTIKSGDTFTLNLRKPDNTIVTASVTATQGNKYVDIVTTEQICAVVGYNLCDLTITNGSAVIGTLNFIMAIERDVLADGIPSESVIEDLDALVAEAVTDFCYTKTETDELLSAKADADSVYTKAETDNLLNDKADANTVYTKSETDNLLDSKADADSVYTKSEADSLLNNKADKSETYTKSETDNLLNYKADADTVYTKTETDNLLSAKADSSDVYNKSEIDNALSGKADANSVYTKSETDNLLNAKADKSTTYTKTETDNLLNAKADANTVYTKTETDNLLSSKANTSDLPTKTSDLINNSGFASIDDTTTANNKVWSSKKTYNEIIDILPTGTASGSVANFTTSSALPLKLAKFGIVASGGGGTPSTPISIVGYSNLVVKQADGDMTTINTITIELGNTIYGGEVVKDKNGTKLKITWEKKNFSEIPNWYRGNLNTAQTGRQWYADLNTNPTYNSDDNTLCNSFAPSASNWAALGLYEYHSSNRYFVMVIDDNYSTKADMLAAYGDVEFTLKLKTPIEFDIADIGDIVALIGTNNIFVDSGNTEVVYRKSIDEAIAELQALILNN